MAKLKDVCDKITDGSHNPPQGINHSQYLMVSSKNIADDRITFENPRYLTEEDFVFENKRTAIKIGDLLLTIVGTVGRVAVVPPLDNEICLQRSVAVLKPKHGLVESRFLMYQLQHMRPILEMEAKGVAQKGIYLKQVENLEVSIPPLETQKQIAATLDKVTALIDKHKRQLKLLDGLVKSRFVELFGDPVDNDKGWPTEVLDSVCSTIVDCPHSTPNYTSEDTGYMCIRTSIVKKNRILWDEIEYIPEQEYNQRIQRKKPERGDIVYTREGAILGIAAMIDRDCNVALGQRSMLLSPNTSKCLPQFLSVAMNFDSFLRKALGGISGSASPHINVGNIKAFAIILPPIELQQHFATFVEQTDKSKYCILATLIILRFVRKTINRRFEYDKL